MECNKTNGERSIKSQVGLTLVKENKIDVILCDILMPVMDGLEVFHGIRNDSLTRKIQIIFNSLQRLRLILF